MHPILAHGRRLAWYLFIWFVVGLSFSVFLARQVGLGFGAAATVGLPLVMAFAFVCLSAWYVSRYTPLGRAGPVRLIGSAVGASVLSSAAWVALARGWCAALERWAGVDAPFESLAPIVFGFGQVAYMVSLAVSYVAGAAEQARAAEHRALQVQVLSREAELRSLRAQIDPHFIFNSLHSISALTTSDATAAREMCLLLADFLRDSLRLGANSRISFADEWALAERFLAIEQVRLGSRLRIARENDPAAAGCPVPPLLLQPLVENAVIHGVSQLVDGGTIRMTSRRNGSTLTVTVENPCDPDRLRTRGVGLGLELLRKRLMTEFGVHDAIRAEERAGLFKVEVRIPVAAATQ